MPNPAETYERSIVPYLFRPWAQVLIDRASVQPGERVLDVACGTGIVAREAAKIVGSAGKVVGVDVSPAMLAVAQEVAAGEGVSAEWRESDAGQLPSGDDSFDAVFCQQGLQFFPQRDAAVREMHRVLAPGGRALVSVWRDLELHPFFAALDEVMRAKLDVGAAAAPFALSDADELHRVLADAGFSEVSVEQVSMTSRYPDPERNLYETVQALAAVAPALQGLDEAERARVIEEVTDEMREANDAVTEGDHVVLEWHANVAAARRAP